MTDIVQINSAVYANKEQTLIDFSLTRNGVTFPFTYAEWDKEDMTLALTNCKDRWPPIQSHKAPVRVLGGGGEQIA